MRIQTLFLSLSLLCSPGATAGERDYFDSDKIYFVHVSDVMAKENTKIAGSQRSKLEDLTSKNSPSFLDDGKNIRTRFTLHHSVGGMVPAQSHVHSINIFGINFVQPSNLRENKDTIAYLDTLSSFKGEVVAGFIDDMMTLDRHVYGLSSIVIVPLHKRDEFKANNPTYQGQFISFDPEQQSMREQIDTVIKEKSDGLTFPYLWKTLCNPQQSYKLESLFPEEFIFEAHCNTPFYALEQVLSPYFTQIHRFHRRDSSLRLLPLHQLGSRLEIISFLFNEIIQLSVPYLNTQKKEALNAWYADTLNWFNLFKLETLIRTSSQSIFLTNPFFTQFIEQRAHWQNLCKLAEGLPQIKDPLKFPSPSLDLFPELLNNTNEWDSLIYSSPFSRIIRLKERLLNKGFNDEGYGILLIRLLHDMKNNLDKSCIIDPSYINLFTECLKKLASPHHMKGYMKSYISRLIREDKSFMNKSSLALLNSAPGRLLRQVVWGKETPLTFWDLFYQLPSLKLLTASYEDLDGEDYDKKFIFHVRQWAINLACKQMYYQPDSQTVTAYTPPAEFMKDTLKNPKFSLANIGQAEHIADTIEFFRLYLHFSLVKSDNPLQLLIDLGCFASWHDLLYKILPLADMLPYEIKECISSNQFNFLPISIASFHTVLHSYQQEKRNKIQDIQEFIDIRSAYYRDLFQQAEDFVEGKGGDRHAVPTVLNLLVSGHTDMHWRSPETQIVISQNWPKAQQLYIGTLQHLSKTAKPFIYRSTKKRLDEIMKPVFSKAVVLYQSASQNSYP